MSISINNLLSQFRVQLPILTTLPETVPAGAEFYYQGTKWRGLGAGETGLPEGTPWPVKGYKEWVGLVANPPNPVVPIRFDIDINVTIEETSTGLFTLTAPGVDANSVVYFNDSITPAVSVARTVLEINPTNNSQIKIRTQVLSGGNWTNTNGLLGQVLSIRIYPPQP
jgi:hypothetical protein